MFKNLPIRNLYKNCVDAGLEVIALGSKAFLAFESLVNSFAQKGALIAEQNINPILSFTIKRLPNYKEVLASSIMQSTIDTLAGRVKLAFGSNPTAAAIIRDISKYPSISTSVAGNTSIGYTDVTYDKGTLYASQVKIICKTTILGSYSLYSNVINTPYLDEYSKSLILNEGKVPNTKIVKEKSFEMVARIGNGVCEAPSRFLNIATREKQRLEKANPGDSKKEFLNFVQEDYKLSWVGEAIMESTTKTLTSDQVGEFVTKKIGYTNYIRNNAHYVDNAISLVFFAKSPFEERDDIWSKAYKCGGLYLGDIAGLETYKRISYSPVAAVKAIVVFTATGVTDWIAKAANEGVASYVLGTPTRVVQDTTGVIMRQLTEVITDSKTLFEPLFNTITYGFDAKHESSSQNIGDSDLPGSANQDIFEL